MNIELMKTSDKDILELFSEHDDYMIDFLGEDGNCYTRYNVVFQQGLYI